jgi:hypothetical protein
VGAADLWMLEPSLVLLGGAAERPGESKRIDLRHGGEPPVMSGCLFSVCCKGHSCSVDTRPRRRAVARRRFRSWPRPYELSNKLHWPLSSLLVRLRPIFIAAPQRGQRLIGLETVSV